jgi:hypothetical protein
VAKWTGGLIAICLLMTAAGYALVRGYLHSDSFRTLLSNQVSRAAGVKGGFSPFRWEGLALRTERYTATGDGPIRELRIDGLETEVGLDSVRRGVWELKNSRISRLQVSLDARKPQADDIQGVVSLPVPKVQRKHRWLPREVEVQGVELGQLSLDAMSDQGLVEAEGVRVVVENEKKHHAYRVELSGGTLRLPIALLPEVRLDRARLRIQPEAAFLTSLSAGAFSGARIDASGEWGRLADEITLEGRASGVKCDELLNEDWSRRLTGEIDSDFNVTSRGGTAMASGHLVISNGVLTALPVLDALAAYADTRRFRTLILSEAHTSWRWQKDRIELRELVLASDSLIRLEGTVVIRGRELDGDLRLGLAPGTLASIPGAETHVFAPGERGLLWAPLRLSGTLEKPREDLTDRLISAAGLRMLETLPETGEKVLKFSRTLLGDDPARTVEKGIRLIEEGSKTVREVSGILDGILGAPRRKPDPEPPENDSPD